MIEVIHSRRKARSVFSEAEETTEQQRSAYGVLALPVVQEAEPRRFSSLARHREPSLSTSPDRRLVLFIRPIRYRATNNGAVLRRCGAR